jgi:hypothetical protein
MLDHLVDAAVPLEDGSFVSAKVARIAEIIHDMDPNLEVQWVPRDRREPDDDAFRIIERTRDGGRVVAFSVKSEAEFDERVIERIYLGDTHKHDVWSRTEAHNEAVKLVEAKKAREAKEAAREFAQAVFNSPLNTYVHNGIRFDRPYGGRRDL